jgi:hypothetical protein
MKPLNVTVARKHTANACTSLTVEKWNRARLSSVGRIAGPYHLVRLRPLLALYDVELHIVTFLEALISIHLDRAVVNEHIGPVVPANKTIPFCVIEPLHFASVLSHVREPFMKQCGWGFQPALIKTPRSQLWFSSP